METWDETVLHINNSTPALGNRRIQLLGMHAVTGCDSPYARVFQSEAATAL